MAQEGRASDKHPEILGWLEQVRSWQAQGKPAEIRAWAAANSKAAARLYDWLLADALFARLHGVPSLVAEPVVLLGLLAGSSPESKSSPLLPLLTGENFQDRVWKAVFEHDHEPDQAYSYSLNDMILRQGQAWLYRVDDLPELEPPQPADEIFDKMSYHESLVGESGEISPETLIMHFYISLWSNEAAELDELTQRAAAYGMKSLQALVLLEHGRQAGSAAEAKTIYLAALAQARALESPLLEAQALLALARLKLPEADSHAAAARALIDGLPAGDLKLYLRKRWADHLLISGEPDAARAIYRELSAQNRPWLLSWLIETIGQTRDSKLLPLIEALTRHPEPTLAEAALTRVLELSPQAGLSEVLKQIEPGLTEASRGLLLSLLPPVNPEANLKRMAEALKYGSIEEQLGALSYLKRHYHTGPGYEPAPLLVETARLLANPNKDVKLAALAYLSQNLHYDPGMLALLAPEVEPGLQAEALRLLRPLAEQLPVVRLQDLLQRQDPQVRLAALALLVTRGKRGELADFIALWRDEHFANDKGLTRVMAEALTSGRVGWDAWRRALDQALDRTAAIEASDEDEDWYADPELRAAWMLQSKLINVLSAIEPLPEAAVRHLDSLLASRAEVRVEIIYLLMPAPRNPERSRRIAAYAKAPEESVRAAVLLYLSEESDPKWRPLFEQGLQDESEMVRQTARRVLAQESPEDALTQLDCSAGMSERELLAFINSLIEAGVSPASLRPRLQELAKGRSENFRLALVQDLLNRPGDYLDPALLNEVLLTSQEAGWLLRSLRERPALIASATIVKLLASEQAELRAAALLLGASKGDPGLFDPMARLLEDRARLLPRRLTELGFQLYPEPTGPISLRELAIEPLRQLDQGRLLERLARYTQDPDPGFRARVLETLLRADQLPVSPEALDKLLADPDPAIRLVALKLNERRLLAAREPGQKGQVYQAEIWLPFLQEANPSVRMQALQRLRAYPKLDPKLIAPLLQDPDPAVRFDAQDLYETLSKSGSPKTLGQVVTELSGRPYGVENYRRTGLPPGLSWDAVYAALLAKLRGLPADDFAADAITQALTAIRGHEALPDLIALLDTGSLNPYFLTSIVTPEDIPALTKLLREARSPAHLAFGLVLLNQLGASGQVALAIPHLAHSDYEVYSAALKFVGHHGSEQERLALMPYLLKAETRTHALTALAMKPLPAAVPKLLAMLKAADREQRSAAIALAGNWRLREAVPELLALFGSKLEAQDASHISRALGRIGDPAALPGLRKAIAQGVNLSLIEALYRLGDVATAQPALLSFFKTASSDGRVDALDLLTELTELDEPDPGLVPFLLELLPSREAGSRMRRGVGQADYLEVGALARDLLAKVALPEHVVALIRMAPRLSAEREEDLDFILEGMLERRLQWSPDVLAELEALSRDADPQIRSLASSWLKQIK